MHLINRLSCLQVKRNFIALLQQDNGKQDLFDDFQVLSTWFRFTSALSTCMQYLLSCLYQL